MAEFPKLTPIYTPTFNKQLESNQFRQHKERILAMCERLCENPKAGHSHELKGILKGKRSADIPKSGSRGSHRIIYVLSGDDSEINIQEGTIMFLYITDTH